jgi:hypothetical protein
LEDVNKAVPVFPTFPALGAKKILYNCPQIFSDLSLVKISAVRAILMEANAKLKGP